MNAITILEREKFEPLGHPFEKTRVSVGFPDGSKKAIGQYWYPQSTKDGYGNIFIHPGQGDPGDILAILVHELVHNSCGVTGHGKKFKKLALEVGLEGKMRATVAGKELKSYLKKLARRLGKFPHSAIRPNAKPPTKKQSTRMIKMDCSDCGYIVRASTTAIVEHGPVICPCNNEQMSVEMPDEE